MADVQLAQNIVRKFWNRGWPKPIKYLGGGMNGKVYEGNNGRLIKFIANRNPAEFEALKNLQGTHVVPRHGPKNAAMFNLKFIGINANRVHRNMFPKLANTPTNMTVVVMGKVGGNKGMTLATYLRRYYPANKANVQRRVKYLVEQMHLKGWAHGNLHSGNIIVSVSPKGRITGMWVIDFGRAYKLNGQTEREAFMKLKYDPAYKTFATSSAFNNGTLNVPIRGSPLRRANVHMMNVHYGKRIEPAQEQKWRNIRKFALNEVAKYLKSPKRKLGRKLSTPRRSPKKPTPRRRVSA